MNGYRKELKRLENNAASFEAQRHHSKHAIIHVHVHVHVHDKINEPQLP